MVKDISANNQVRRRKMISTTAKKLNKSTKSLALLAAILVAVILQTSWLVTETEAIGKLLFSGQNNHLRFCYQPGDQTNQQSAPLSSQCVYCARNQFDMTLFRCTGLSAVQQMINTTQAFCIISHCLDQIRNQVPVLLG